DAVVLARKYIVFAQRVALPVIGAQDPSQVGMPVENDAEHVIGLTLVPIGGRPEIPDAANTRIVSGAKDLYCKAVPQFEAPQIIRHAPLSIGHVTHAEKICEPVKLKP